MTEQEKIKLKKGFMNISELMALNIPSDLDYPKALSMLLKQYQLTSNIDEKEFSQQIQEKRLKEDIKNKKKEYDLEKERQEFQKFIETTKIKLEEEKLNLEKLSNKILIENQKEERKLKYITLLVTATAQLATILIPLIVYKNLAYSNLKLIYRDEGRPTQDFKDAVKCINGMTKK